MKISISDSSQVNPSGHRQPIGSSSKKRSLPDENLSTSPTKKRQCLEVPSSDRTTRSTAKDQELGKVQSLTISPSRVNNQGSVLKDVHNSPATLSASSTSVKPIDKSIETSSPASIIRSLGNLSLEPVNDRPERPATEEEVSQARYRPHRTLWVYILSLCQVQRHELRDKIQKQREAEEAELGFSFDDFFDVNALAMTELEEAEDLFQSRDIDLSGDLDDAIQLLTGVATLHPDVRTVYHLLQVCKVWKDAFPDFEEFSSLIELAFRDGSLLRRLDELLPPYEVAQMLYETMKRNLHSEA